MTIAEGRTRAPAIFWIVGVLSLLWNAMGAFDYFMTRTRNADYVKSVMPDADPWALFAWVEAFPIWAQAGYGLGPWCGVAGSLLLLMRSRFAFHAFALSLLGMVLSFGYTFLGAPPMPGAPTGAAEYMPVLIMIIGVALLWFASTMRKKGVLR